jgi:peptidoglycan/xylan/chitin deacetylase (PgdA/CDA1 family)
MDSEHERPLAVRRTRHALCESLPGDDSVGARPATRARGRAAAGHDVEAHSVLHERGPTYVERHGLAAYLDEEVLPSIELLRADGYEVLSYAYPFGVRTDETDRAILDTGSVQMVRSLAKPNQLRANPCPN